jgi:excisionase family DNA binding protein
VRGPRRQCLASTYRKEILAEGVAVQTNYLTINQAAEQYGVNRRTVRRRIADGHLPAYRMAGSRYIRIKTADLDKLLTPVPTGGSYASS